MIFNATDCGSFLREYDTLLERGDSPGSTAHSPETTDVVDFLLAARGLDDLTFRPLAATVAVHEPCSQRNVLKNQSGVYRLLERIPGLRASPGIRDKH